ncbi:MAG: tRNA dihydrouridine synthase DusB [Anaerolineae bacterium]|nr:tRNA dihydrouridine synthase DusB [Anaerolineae bacterium]
MPQGRRPTFLIGGVPVYGELALAPMAGFSDLPFRVLCREFGSALDYIPFVSDEAVIRKVRRGEKAVDWHPKERPVIVQLVSKDEARLAEAGRLLEEAGADILDLNLGCPARKVAGRGKGAGLLREPAKVERLLTSLVQAVSIPVMAKIRLGWDDSQRNYLEVARIVEGSGAAAIAVHGRTKEQGFSGRADWQAIAEVKQAVGIPVLANGDVRCVADIEAIKAQTGCEGVLIGRGAIGNPWIFARRDISEVPYEERLSVIRRHLRLMVSYYGERMGVVLFRKHVVKYIQGLPGAAALRPRLVHCETAAELLHVLEQWGVERVSALEKLG